MGSGSTGGFAMVKIVVWAIIALVVATILGWISWFSGTAQDVYKALYGKPMAHPKGGTADHINDWLTFLPSDPLTRGAIACGFIAALLVLSFVANILGIRWAKWRSEVALERESRIRTMNSFHKS
jgi:hypothetical protein